MAGSATNSREGRNGHFKEQREASQPIMLDTSAKVAAEKTKWDAFYASYAIPSEDPTLRAFGEELTTAISAFLPTGSSILEAGCGAGWESLALARVGNFQVSLLDFSHEALHCAGELFQREGLTAEFTEGDVFTPGTPDYDLVFNAGVLEHYTLDEQVAFLRGMASRSSNYVLVLVPNRLCYWYWLWRIHSVSAGEWPYGKEVPLVDLSSAFKAAGLYPIGQAFMGASWTESYISTLLGLSEPLRQEILEVHRSHIEIPLAQKSYLTAFLGSVTPHHTSAVSLWSPPAYREDMQKAELNAILADTVSLRINAEHSLTLLRREVAQRDELLNMREEELAQSQNQYQQLEAQHTHLAQEHQATMVQLDFIYSTKTWKLIYLYWDCRRQGLKGWLKGSLKVLRFGKRSLARRAKAIPHRLYHLLVPYRIRMALWGRRHRQFLQEQAAALAEDQDFMERARDELQDIIEQYPDAKGIIIFPRTIQWHTKLFQRPHQMALAFAALGYLVLYWLMPDSSDNITGFHKVQDRLHLCNVPAEILRAIEHPLVVTYTYNCDWAAQLNSPIILYEIIDHLDIFDTTPRSSLQRSHAKMLAEAKVVAATSSELLEDMVKQRPDAILCPNAVNFNHFASISAEDEVPEDIGRIVAEGKPIIGYHGALAKWIDYDLLKYACQALPAYNFVFVGPDYDGSISSSGLLQFPNMHMLGGKDHQILPRYVHAFDVATIPFQTTKALQAVSPIKLFEYMASGRPIVTTDLAECRKYPEVLIARNAAEWVEHLSRAIQLRHDPEYIVRVRATALSNTWLARAATLIEASEKPGPNPTFAQQTRLALMLRGNLVSRQSVQL